MIASVPHLISRHLISSPPSQIIRTNNLSRQESDLVETETSIMKAVSHPHLVKMNEIYETPEAVIIAMDVLYGQELFDVVCDKGSFIHQAQYTRAILIACDDLSSSRLLYRA